MTAFIQSDWLTSHSTRKVMDALEAERAGSARFVGGCVRNALLGEPVSDIDIATQLTPDVVQRVLKSAGCAVHPTGIEHGTLTVVAEGRPFEVTTLRRDVETDGRRAVVAFTEDWSEDANRRDFTMNALYAGHSGEVYDPTGAGLSDLGRRKVVFVGDPETRLREDYLRILRFFRFHAWYGVGEPEPAGVAACRALAAGLRTISAERIWMELKKLLGAPSPLGALRAMQATGVAAEIFIEQPDIGRLERFLAAERVDDASPDPLLRLLALTGIDPSSARELARRMKASSDERERLTAAGEIEEQVTSTATPEELRRLAYRRGVGAVFDKLMIERSDDPANDAAWASLIDHLSDWAPPECPIRGADVIDAGVPQGPRIGPIVRKVEDEWVASDFSLPRAALLARVAELASEN